MEALLLTVGMIGLMALTLIVLARFWPRSSRRTGYRISGGDPRSDEPPIPEDDDVHWRL